MRTLDPGDHMILPDDAYGGTYRLAAQVHERFGVVWTACDLRDVDALTARMARRDAARLDRDADEPDAERRRHSSRRRVRARAHGPCCRRQHICDAVFAAAAHARRGCVGALVDEVPRRSLGRRRRVHRAARCRVDRRAAVPAERDGRRAVALRLLSRTARREDARGPHACALRERTVDRAATAASTTRSPR